MADLAGEGSYQVLMLLIPAKIQVYDDWWNRAVLAAGAAPEEIAYDWPNRRMIELLSTAGLPYIDMLPVLRGRSGEQFYFETGKTYVIEQYVKMNDAQQANGVVTIHVNGFKVIELTGMVFSQSGAHGINYAFFQFWHGGGTQRWAPSVDSTVYFDNITISERPLTY